MPSIIGDIVIIPDARMLDEVVVTQHLPLYRLDKMCIRDRSSPPAACIQEAAELTAAIINITSIGGAVGCKPKKMCIIDRCMDPNFSFQYIYYDIDGQ